MMMGTWSCIEWHTACAQHLWVGSAWGRTRCSCNSSIQTEKHKERRRLEMPGADKYNKPLLVKRSVFMGGGAGQFLAGKKRGK